MEDDTSHRVPPAERLRLLLRRLPPSVRLGAPLVLVALVATGSAAAILRVHAPDAALGDVMWPLGAIALGALGASSLILYRVVLRPVWSLQGDLARAEARYRAIVERVPAVTYIAEPGIGGRWLYVSPQIEALLGYSAREWMERPALWLERLHPEDRGAVIDHEQLDRQSGHPGPTIQEYRMVARDGRVVWVRDEAFLVRDAAGLPAHYQGLLSDLTERKRVEGALHRAYERERAAGERLRALDEMKNAFLTAVSHELRTPLSSVLGVALTLEREEETLAEDIRRDLLRRLVSNARKLERLLEDLLDLDRLRRGMLEPRRRPVDVTSLARAVAAGAETRGRPVRVAGEEIVVSVDAAKVERIIENLVVNAARHTSPGTPIEVSISSRDGGACIVVEDRGAGIPDELKEEIFEPFRQAAQGPEHPYGAGIGLALVSRFAELHGGRAWVVDRPGGGASFRVVLPGEATDAERPTRPPAVSVRRASDSAR